MKTPSEKTLLRLSLKEHAALLEQAQKSQQASFVASIQSLMDALEARDPYTRGHSERVRAWCIRIARQLRLPDPQVDAIALAARLHDPGKVGVPDVILAKTSPLTREEWQIMRKHPELAVEILSPLRMLEPALEAIRGHHERWDGKGYPDAFKGQAIPLGARIIAVADTYDALVTDRPYRKGFPREKAREILRMGAGTQWDPQIVAALFTVQTNSAHSFATIPVSSRFVQDPVCGMAIALEAAQAQVVFDHRKHYFCSTACREIFDKQHG